jgi:hypothetical protein
MTERICINCKFCDRAELRCMHPEARVTDPVTGDERAPLCTDERAFNMAHTCGRSGMLFEARETEAAA